MIDLKIKIIKDDNLIELSILEFHRLQGLFEELSETIPENNDDDNDDEWGDF